MKIKTTIFKSGLIFFTFFSVLFSQIFEKDSIAVRAILDSNGLFDKSVHSVVKDLNSAGRIVDLSLDNLGLKYLPSQIGDLDSLRMLFSNHNELTTLPSSIKNLKKLIILRVWYNKLTHIPDEFIDHLEYLDSIGEITEEFFWGICRNEEIVFTKRQNEYFNVEDYQEFRAVYCQSIDIKNDFYKKDNIYSKPHLLYSNDKITFSVPGHSNVEIKLFSVKGILIKTLFKGYKERGIFTLKLCKKKYGNGVYYIRLNAGINSIVKKVVIVK